MGFINSAVVWMIILGVKNGELNIFNYFAFLNMVFGRQLVISSKNGFFRSNNWKIF
jgi:trehalose-6-phosphatase